MAWNGSENSAGKKPIKVVTQDGREIRGKRPAVGRGLVAGLSVVVLGVIVTAFFLWPTPEVPVEEQKEKPKKAIAEMTPVEVPKAEPVKEVPVVKPIDPDARPTKVGEVVNGYVLLPSGRLHKRTGVVTNSVAMRPKGKYHIFERSCNNEIAAYLWMQPGDTLVGTMRYNGRFEKDFLESIKEPIVIDPEDTPEQVELKKAVIAARLDLKDAYDRGEDIEKIMSDTREELQRMSQIKMEVTQEFNKLRKTEGATDQDVEDLFDACNKLLEEKGISPMKFGPITRRRMLNQLNQEQE